MTDHMCTGQQFLGVMIGAAAWLEQHIGAVNALNVFPVPDGDTGTNMHLTIAAAIKDVNGDSGVGQVAERIYKNALMGARGNSGVILSQILRGLAQGLAGLETASPADLAGALQQAAATAYKAVMKPVEGTMLTVIRETAEAVAAQPVESVEVLLERAVEAARTSVEKTPTLLKTLRDAGVVDAGGQGLLVLFEGALHCVRGQAPALGRTQAREQTFAVAFKDVHGEDDFGYCTNFLLEGVGIPYEEVRETLAGMGTSAVIVGDESVVKAHLHTLRPGDVLNYAIQFGALSHIEITNMDLQRRELHEGEQRAAAAAAPPSPAIAKEVISTVGVVAVAPGEGFRRIFEGLNAGAVISGGQTMNPSTQDLLQAIETLPQQEVIILPNNSNIILAARQASELTSKQVEVVPSRTVPQGIAAMLAFNYALGLKENEAAMTRALGTIQTAEITTAVRDAVVDGVSVKAGQTIGLLDDTLVESGDDVDGVIDRVLDRMDLESCEIVTIYYGERVDEQQAQRLAERLLSRYPGLGVEVQSGGQPFYDYILSAE